MRIEKDSVVIELEDDALWEAIVNRALGRDRSIKNPRPYVPSIGSTWEGGIYAGVTRGNQGGQDYHLILGPESNEPITWDEAQIQAGEFSKEQGFTLPSCREQLLMRANLSEHFKGQKYWSCESSDFNQSILCLDFMSGLQSNIRKIKTLNARVVRRIPVVTAFYDWDVSPHGL